MLNFTQKNMNSILLHIHSGLRWVALILLIGAILNSMLSKSRNTYEKKDKLLNLFAMISLHLQLTIGFILYFISDKVQFSAGWMKNTLLRFYGMEHVLLMVLAIVIVTIGRKKAENAVEPAQKHGKIVVWYAIGLLLILAGIPWPFRTMLGGGWF